jgi:hypothetical protein
VLFAGFKHKEGVCTNFSFETIPSRKEASSGKDDYKKR